MMGRKVSTQTMHRGLREIGLKAHIKSKRPFLSQHHRKERLDFAIAHKDYSLEDWKEWVWSDEVKFNCRGLDGRKWSWRKKGERLSDRMVQGTVKFGKGSLMMWGCMEWDGVGHACRIEGTMDADLYVSILEDEL